MTDVIGILSELRSGQVISDINQKFRELSSAVLDTTGKGEMVIKLTVKPAKLAIGGKVIEVEIDYESKIKKPELAIGSSLFFVTDDGDLTRDIPGQMPLMERQMEEKQNG